MTFIVVIVIVIILGLIYASMYNGMQRSKVNTEESWSQIDVQLKRRNDLIPNLVENNKRLCKT